MTATGWDPSDAVQRINAAPAGLIDPPTEPRFAVAYRLMGDGAGVDAGGQWWWESGPDGLRAEIGECADPTVTFEIAGPAAAPLQTGEMAPSWALLLGDVSVAGDVNELLANGDLVQRIDRLVRGDA